MPKNAASNPEISHRTIELAGKTAVVTGSTSGIGLGIAQAFAASGMNVMLNGFGAKEQNDALCTDLATRYGVKTAFSPADMSKPAEIAAMIEIGRAHV